MKWLLYIALLISILTYQLWSFLPKGSFYIGNAIFLLLICFYIYIQEKKSFVKFVLFELSLANFINELFFDTAVLTLGEALLIVIVPLIWFIKHGNTIELLAGNKRSNSGSGNVCFREKVGKDTGAKK